MYARVVQISWYQL